MGRCRGLSLLQVGLIPSSAECRRVPSAMWALLEHALGNVLASTSFELVKTPSQLYTVGY